MQAGSKFRMDGIIGEYKMYVCTLDTPVVWIVSVWR